MAMVNAAKGFHLSVATSTAVAAATAPPLAATASAVRRRGGTAALPLLLAQKNGLCVCVRVWGMESAGYGADVNVRQGKRYLVSS